ncbi:MAG: hypothetical protein ACI9DG_001118 [Oleispira sp.]|jgi:hypothetical protein
MKITLMDFSHCKILPSAIILFVEMVACQVRVMMGREEHQLTFGESKLLHPQFACDEMINQPIQQLSSSLELPLPSTYSLM